MFFIELIIIIVLLILNVMLILYPIYIYNDSFIKYDNKNLLNNYNLNDLFNISIYKSKYEPNNYMIIVNPQEYHFFLENEKLIYHPNNNNLDGILKQYYCNENFELAYELHSNISPKVICHRKLSYLKSNIFHNKYIYKKIFNELQNPINGIKIIINDMLKNGEEKNINE